jgi:glucokinase
MTNLDWEIDTATLLAATGAAEGHVINDMEAQGHALDDVALCRVLGPETGLDPTATRLVVGIGTGFNAAPVHPGEGGARPRVVASECGHASLPVWDETSLSLARALAATHGFASIEEALAGRGLAAINAHVAGPDAHPDGARLVTALAGTPTRADRATADLYCAVLGRVLGDLALVHLPFGGICLIGGVARAMAPFLDAHGFAAAFRDKGRFAPFMEAFAVAVVEDDFAALTGCARYVRRQNAG